MESAGDLAGVRAGGEARRPAADPPADVRHTHATLLLPAGVNPKVVSERLGHSSVAFALDTNAHVMPGMQPEAAEKLMEMVPGPAADPEDDVHEDANNSTEDDE